MSSYNERYRKAADAPIGPGFISVNVKSNGKDFSRLHIAGATQEVIERKLMALMPSYVLGNGCGDGLRIASGDYLEELCGFAYMPSALDLFSRELKYIGASSVLWNAHAKDWLRITVTWGTDRQAMVLFVDGTSKLQSIRPTEMAMRFVRV